MSLPPGFLDELRTRLSLTQVVGRKVVWDARKSNQGKGDMWAPCPFHHEKTASFHVDDKKGFYYCFGCHAKGDAINFVRETENVSFMEAVEILAREAAMPMPARDPKAQEKQDRRSQLAEIMEMAVQFFRRSLHGARAEEPRKYLDRRGLSPALQDQFDIGYAPEGNALFAHLREKGIEEKLIIDAGLAARPDDGRAPYDRFRARIIFPIRDPRGRCIAFGGRSLDPNARAKYLNSPETVLFDKGRNLYNHGPARAAAGRGHPLIVAEGYMDVIALVAAGFEAAVAPLGTAITEDQLRLLWRIAPEPIIALDGDTAGVRAAMRLIDLALPMLEAGQSLRFAIMPEGQDPDDLIKSGGAAAVQSVLDGAIPMVNLLWQRETEGKVFDSPERRAALDKDLRAKIALIRDPGIRRHYGEAIKELRYHLFRPNRPQWSGGGKWQPPARSQSQTKASPLVTSYDRLQHSLRQSVILAVILRNPEVLEEFAYDLEGLSMPDPDLARMRDVVCAHVDAAAAGEDLIGRVAAILGEEAVDILLSQPHVALVPPVRDPGHVDFARQTVAEELSKLASLAGLEAEVREAEEDMVGLADEALTWRLKQAAEARDRAMRSQQEDTVEYDRAENGATINREEREALDALMSRINFSKKP